MDQRGQSILYVISKLLAVAILLLFSDDRQALANAGLPIIRDAEAERLLQDYAAPLLKAAGIPVGQIKFVIVNQPGFNAFVIDSEHIIFYADTISQANSPEEIIGVIAHEIGHIKGNHIARLSQAIEDARFVATFGTLLGIGAIAAGANSNSQGMIEGGAGLALAGSGVGQRLVLAHRRSEEAAADRAALQLLERAQYSAAGMLETLRRLADQELFSSTYADPYLLTHPSPRERLRKLENGISQSAHFSSRVSQSLIQRHALVRAKFRGFLASPSQIARAYPPEDNSLAAEYARSIILMRQSRIAEALDKIDGLIRHAPNNGYFYELRGQILMSADRVSDAIAALRIAVVKQPRQPQIAALLASALLAKGGRGNINEAVKILRKAVKRDANLPLAHRHLAIGLAQLGRKDEAALATANALFIEGDLEAARLHAARAAEAFSHGTPQWLQAQDILLSTNGDWLKR